MTQSHIDIKLNTSHNVQTRLLERPGLWMNAKELSDLREDLTTVATKTLSKDTLDYGVFSKNSDALSRSIITLVYEKENNKPIAFNALALIDFELGKKPVNVLHLGLVMIDPNARSQVYLGFFMASLASSYFCVISYAQFGFQT